MGLSEKIVIVGLGLLIIILLATSFLNKDETLKQLKDRYLTALQGTDREKALEAGRAYYRYKFGNELSEADEQQIRKDIDDAMPPEPEL